MAVFVSNENTLKNDDKELYLTPTTRVCAVFPFFPLLMILVFNLLVSVRYGTMHFRRLTHLFN